MIPFGAVQDLEHKAILVTLGTLVGLDFLDLLVSQVQMDSQAIKAIKVNRLLLHILVKVMQYKRKHLLDSKMLWLFFHHDSILNIGDKVSQHAENIAS